MLILHTLAGMDAVRARSAPWNITPPNWFRAAEELRRLAVSRYHDLANCLQGMCEHGDDEINTGELPCRLHFEREEISAMLAGGV